MEKNKTLKEMLRDAGREKGFGDRAEFKLPSSMVDLMQSVIQEPKETVAENLAQRDLERLREYAMVYELDNIEDLDKEELIKTLVPLILRRESILEAVRMIDFVFFAPSEEDPKKIVATPDYAISYIKYGLAFNLRNENQMEVFIPDEVGVLIKELRKDGQWDHAIQCVIIHQLALVCVNLYGMIPLDELHEMLEDVLGREVSRDYFDTCLISNIHLFGDYGILNEDLLHTNLMNLNESKKQSILFPKIRERIEKKPRFTPSLDEFFYYANQYNRMESDALDDLRRFIEDDLCLTEDIFNDLVDSILFRLNLSWDYEMIKDLSAMYDSELGIELSEDQKEVMTGIIDTLIENTRLWFLQGYTPLECNLTEEEWEYSTPQLALMAKRQEMMRDYSSDYFERLSRESDQIPFEAKPTLAENLLQYDMDRLRYYAGVFKVDMPDDMEKEELVIQLSNKMLEVETLADIMKKSSVTEWAEREDQLDMWTMEPDFSATLMDYGYWQFYMRKGMYVDQAPDDVMERIEEMKKSGLFYDIQNQMTVHFHSLACVNLYGYISLDELFDRCNLFAEKPISREAFDRYVDANIKDFERYKKRQKELFHLDLIDISRQKGLYGIIQMIKENTVKTPPYIPNENDFDDYMMSLFRVDTDEAIELENYMTDKLKMDSAEVDLILLNSQLMMSLTTDCNDHSFVVASFLDLVSVKMSPAQKKELISLVKTMYVNTRLWCLRGHTPTEYQQMIHAQSTGGTLSMTENHTISTGEPIVNAFTCGRNDPCPCGSGKKYKKCCLK